MKYNKCEPSLKIFNSHYFKFRRGQDQIEYRHYFNSDSNFVKLKKRKQPEIMFPEKLKLVALSEERIERIKKLDEFISLSKKDDFYSTLHSPFILCFS